MNRPRLYLRNEAFPFPASLLAAIYLTAGACASSGPVIPDTRDRIPPLSAREGADPNDVFMRKPWEIWRVPGGTARYHREAFILLPDNADSFKAADVSVYAADGSDVRIDYVSVDLGENSQWRESISVFVYRAPGPLESEWTSVVDRMRHQHPGANPIGPLPLPAKYPATTKQMALMEPGRAIDRTNDTFVQVSLFHQDEWAIRYEISCPLTDVAVARDMTRSFLGSLRARE